MKFVNYDPTQKLNTIQGGTQASGNEMAYGGNQQGPCGAGCSCYQLPNLQ